MDKSQEKKNSQSKFQRQHTVILKGANQPLLSVAQGLNLLIPKGLSIQSILALKKKNPDLLRGIRKWEERVTEEAKQLGINIPDGYETFAQAMTFTHLGYADENPAVAELLEISKNIFDEFTEILNLGEIPVML